MARVGQRCLGLDAQHSSGLLQLSPLPEALGSRRGGEYVLWQAQGLKIEQNKPEIWSWGELNYLSLAQ